jgi:stage II sporulation protein D
MPPKWPLEALIAQAIAARTYTIYKMEETAGKSWDVVATTGDQVYGGKAREVESTNRAVTVSKGVTLSFEGKPARTYYHSTSGVRTESSKIVFDETPLPYLMGVGCIYGNESPHRFWKEEILFSEIEEQLRKKGITTGKLIKLTPKSFTTSGRINELNLHTLSDKRVIKATLFRKIMGTTRVKSTWFRTRSTLDRVVLSGRGFGHGVGLCQWGAKGMAERGMAYKQILLHYYPGTTLTPYELPAGYLEGI